MREGTAGLVAFYRAQLDKDEAWALAASKPYRYADGDPQVPSGGVHWTWVVGENWEPVTPDPAVDEFVAIGGNWSANLATVEQWPSSCGGLLSKPDMMPTTYAATVEEMDAAAAGHIVRQDPARTLARVKAGRRLIVRYERAVRVGGRSVSGFVNGQDDGYAQACLDAIRDAATVYASEPGYKAALPLSYTGMT